MRRIFLGAAVALLLAVAPASAQAAPTISHYGLPLLISQPINVALGSDGNVWFTETTQRGIGRITPAGSVLEYIGLTETPSGITAGPGGNLYFTENESRGAIGRITTGGSAIEVNAGLTSGSNPNSIVKGPDGNLWFTEPAQGGAIGRITTQGVITEFRTGLTSGSQPWGITVGPDGNLWFAERGGRIGRITPQGAITEFSAGISSGAVPQFIATGPDGNLWFTESGSPARIGRITPQGAITEFSTGLTPTANPRGITAGGDGSMYFTEYGGAAIGKITTTGTITQFSTGFGSGPYGITTGADGNLWFADASAGQIGQMTVAPGVGNVSASAVTSSSATVASKVTPNSQATNYWFEYGPTPAYGSSTAASASGSAGGGTSRTAALSSLAPATTYHVRAAASNATGTTYGADYTFTTTGIGAPSATTDPAAGVTSSAGTLAATVNPQSTASSYHFEWGPTPAYGTSVPQPDGSLPADAADHPLTEPLAGLEPNTTYYYRVVATSVNGTTYGDQKTFTTAEVVPDATSGAAAGVTGTTATLGGTVNPRNSGTGWHFEYGKAATYGSSAPDLDAALAADNSDHGVSHQVTGLEPNTTYHYRLVAANNAGETDGQDRTFKTAAVAPDAETKEALDITIGGATLAGVVNPRNSEASYRFEWGETTAYRNQSRLIEAGGENEARSVKLPVDGLAPDTTYHYRVVASSDAGNTYGADQSFSTAPLAPDATTMAATDLTVTGATLRGRLDPRRRATSYSFDYGPVGGSLSHTDAATARAEDGPADVSAPIAGLLPGTTYRYRLVAESTGGTGAGAEQTFRTPVVPPTPQIGASVVATPANGTVRFRPPGSSSYTTLDETSVVPVGSRIDTRRGAIDLVTAIDSSGRTQTAKFWHGVFTVRQSKRGYTDLYVAPPTGCRAAARTGGVSAAGNRRRNSLWGRDRHGRYHSHGRGSIATVRGTTWLTESRCDGTKTRVKEGKVAVRDLRRHVTVLVRAGHSYLARTRP